MQPVEIVTALGDVSDVVYTFDRELLLIQANPAAVAVLGRSVGERLDPAAGAWLEQVRHGAFEREEQGSDRTHWTWRYTPLRDRDGRVEWVHVIGRDVTGHRTAASRVAQLQSVTMKLAATISLQAIGEIVIGEVHEELGAVATVVYLGPEGSDLPLVASRGLEPELPRLVARLSRDSDLPLAEAIRAGEPLWVEDPDELLAAFPSLATAVTPRRNLQAIAAVPCRFEQRTFGGIAFSWSAPRRFDGATREFLLAVATQCAQAAERTRLLDVERKARARLEVLVEASRQLSAARLDLPQVLGAVCRTIVQLADGCAIHLVGSDGRLDPVAAHLLDPEAETSALQALARSPARVGDATLLGRVASDREGVFVPVVPPEGLSDGLSAEHRAHLERFPIASLIVAPLRSAGQGIGTLTAVRGPASPPFEEHDRALVAELADRAALSIDNARLYAAAAEARERSDAALRVKDEFLALLGHELRNPLAPILNGLKLLRLRPGDTGRTLDILDRQSRHLARLVDDLLDVSRITAGRLELRRERVDLDDVVGRAIEQTRPLLDQREIHVHDRVSAGLTVDADPDRLTQVFGNLLSNAAKYSPKGSLVEITGERVDSRIRATVQDRGCGIAADELPVIFDPFTRGGKAGAPSGGLGLGLAIVRNLVELHGGAVRAESAGLGAGSTFVVELPAARP